MAPNLDSLSYILITPARNGERLIGMTIDAIVAQTVRPKWWIIVSDGSTDRTDDIVKSYQCEHAWIELVRMPEHRDRHFAAKVNCFNASYEKVWSLDYQIIGNLDADISFEADFSNFSLRNSLDVPTLEWPERLMSKMEGIMTTVSPISNTYPEVVSCFVENVLRI